MSDSKKKQALYHRDGWKPKVLTVAAENGDGTLDLADAKGSLVVTKCPVSSQPENGHATLVGAADLFGDPPSAGQEKEAAEKNEGEGSGTGRPEVAALPEDKNAKQEKEAPPKKKAADGSGGKK